MQTKSIKKEEIGVAFLTKTQSEVIAKVLRAQAAIHKRHMETFYPYEYGNSEAARAEFEVAKFLDDLADRIYGKTLVISEA